MNSDQVVSTTRSVLTALGGIVVALGYIDATNASALVGALVGLVGAALTVWGIVWGIWSHTHASQIAAGARSIEAAPDATSVAPVTQALRSAGAEVNTSMLPANPPAA